MTQWPEMTLGEVCELKRGYDLPKSNRCDGTVPVVSSSGISGFHSKAKVRAPGVVTGRYGTLGEVFYLEEDFWPLNTALYVRDFKGNDPRFVAALLESMELRRYDGAAAVPGLNRNHLHKVMVRVPDIEDQATIAVILRVLDDLIESNRSQVEVLEEMARAIYREWFVHFRYPGHEDATFVDSPLGPIPQGWEVKPVGEIAEARRGLSWGRSSESETGGTPVVTIPNLKARLDLDGSTMLADVSDEDQTRFSLMAGDVLLIGSNGNPARVGHAVRVPATTGALFASFLMRVRADSRQTSPNLLFHQLGDTNGVIAALKATAVGTTGLRNLRITVLRDALLCVPDSGTRQRFDNVCSAVHAAADVLEAQARGLRLTRDLLLPALVTGSIDVSSLDVGALVGETAE
jgi:type I restriction enzyme, S subunit